MTFLKQNWFRISIVVGLLLTVVVIFYALVIIPKQEQSKLELKKRLSTILRNSCLSDADAEYSSLQELNGTKHTSADGSISYTVSLTTRSWIEGRVKDMKDECYRKYPQ